MNVCKTDVQQLVRLLRQSALLIDRYCQKPSEQDTARRCRIMIRKIERKHGGDTRTSQAQ